MLIVGGGYIAVEFAAISRGSHGRHACYARRKCVARFDDDLRLGCATACHAGVKLHFGMLPTRIEKTPTGYHVSLTRGESLDASK